MNMQRVRQKSNGYNDFHEIVQGENMKLCVKKCAGSFGGDKLIYLRFTCWFSHRRGSQPVILEWAGRQHVIPPRKKKKVDVVLCGVVP